jgi:glycosyltransferase involved in cell wall biosynthesis
MPSFYVGAVLLTDDSARMPRGGAILTRHGLPWRLAEAMKPEIDVVIVSYNNRETLRECVEPLVARPGVTVTVVDNASSDNSLAAVADLPVRRLNSGRNGGFAFACNIGMAFGRAPLVLFLNPDARIELGDLERLASVLAPEPGLFATFARSRVRFARLHAGPASAFAQRLGLNIGALTHVLVNAGRRDLALGHATALWTTLARHAR